MTLKLGNYFRKVAQAVCRFAASKLIKTCWPAVIALKKRRTLPSAAELGSVLPVKTIKLRIPFHLYTGKTI